METAEVIKSALQRFTWRNSWSKKVQKKDYWAEHAELASQRLLSQHKGHQMPSCSELISDYLNSNP